MRRHRTLRSSRRGVTLVELLIALVISTILLLGMGMVLVIIFTGIRESRNFFEATSRVDLIRQLSFDARTGNQLLWPQNDGDTGLYPPTGGNVGHQVQFNSLVYDSASDTTTDALITWESRRPSGAPAGTPYTVFRFVDGGFTFAQDNMTEFDVLRTSADSFNVTMETEEDTERVQVQLTVTLRNVIQ